MIRIRKVLTVDDVLAVGACADRVVAFHRRHFPEATAVALEDALAAATTDEERSWIELASGYDGGGDGDGYGGDGYGGYGDGDGYGGYGGYGDDGGYGDGYGGYGDGDGDGGGYGDGDGDGCSWEEAA